MFQLLVYIPLLLIGNSGSGFGREEFNFSNAFDPSLTRFCRGENMIEMKFLEGDGEVKQRLLACGQQLTGRPDTLSYAEAVTLAPPCLLCHSVLNLQGEILYFALQPLAPCPTQRGDSNVCFCRLQRGREG